MSDYQFQHYCIKFLYELEYSGRAFFASYQTIRISASMRACMVNRQPGIQLFQDIIKKQLNTDASIAVGAYGLICTQRR